MERRDLARRHVAELEARVHAVACRVVVPGMRGHRVAHLPVDDRSAELHGHRRVRQPVVAVREVQLELHAVVRGRGVPAARVVSPVLAEVEHEEGHAVLAAVLAPAAELEVRQELAVVDWLDADRTVLDVGG